MGASDFYGSRMVGIESSLSNIPEGWNGWVRVPVTLRADMARSLNATFPKEKVLLLLDAPPRAGFNAEAWLTWSSQAVSDAWQSGVRMFQIGRAGEGEEKGWGEASQDYFQSVFLPVARKIKEQQGKLIFCGVPWKKDGDIPTRWMFENSMQDVVDILGSSSCDPQELEYLERWWLNKGVCDAVWMDEAKESSANPSGWASHLHQFLDWSLKHQSGVQDPVVFFLPRVASSQQAARPALFLASHLLDGPLSPCDTSLLLYPKGKASGFLVGSMFLANLVPAGDYPTSLTVVNCTGSRFNDSIAFSLVDGSRLEVNTRPGPNHLNATVIKPPQEGCYIQYMDSGIPTTP